MSCDNLCTAAKCEELEARIGALEQALELIEASFEAHTSQDIPEAHDYTPEDPEVTVGVFARGENQFGVSVTVGENQAQDSFSIEVPEPEDPEVSVGVFALGNNQYGVSVTVGKNQAQDSFLIEIPEPEDPEVDVSVINNGNNDFSIAVTVDGIRDEDLLSIGTIAGERGEPGRDGRDGARGEQGERGEPGEQGEPGELLNCDNITQDIGQEIQDCCNQILLAIANISNQINQVEQEITIDISDTINSQYECVENEETQIIEPKLVPTNYSNKGLLGLHEHLKLMSANMDAIFKPLCEISTEVKNETVVSLVASPKYVTNIQGKVLVLHFVTLNNYPKRKAGSYPRQIQIPGAKDTYDWEEDFLDLRWVQGNQYAELELEGYVAKVSGWFSDATAANNYFDDVLSLTTGIEKNRNIPDHSNPRTDIAVVQTRPYRAFIESVDSTGTAICHAKYTPVESI